MSHYDPEIMIPFLKSASLELTNHCNVSCKICWSQNPQLYPPREKGYMQPELFKNIIDQLAEYYNVNHKRILLGLSYGGESLLHPSFAELLAYASSKRCFEIHLISNGLLLADYIGTLKKYRVRVTISYHDLKNSLRKQVDQNIKSLLARRGHTPVNIAVVDAEAPGLFKEAKDKFGDMVYNYPLITEDLKYIDGKRDFTPYCKFPFINMAVLWNGDVWPCCRLLSSDFPSLGNLNKQTLMEVWDGELYRSLRLDIPERDDPYKGSIGHHSWPCFACELW